MTDITNLGNCGVDCSVCTDYLQGKCESCRATDWTDENICMPVKCCREKGISVCGQCSSFPCGNMAEFYEESDSHRQAGERMLLINREQEPTVNQKQG